MFALPGYVKVVYFAHKPFMHVCYQLNKVLHEKPHEILSTNDQEHKRAHIAYMDYCKGERPFDLSFL